MEQLTSERTKGQTVPPAGSAWDEPGRLDRVLAHDSEFVIFDGQSARKTLLIVFSYIDQPVGTRTHGRFLQSIDCKRLFLNPGRNHWHQTGVPGIATNYSGVEDFCAAVARRFADHKILCLGHSMGGFAAMGIGVAIGAERIFASVPEIALNLPGSVSARYLHGVAIERGDLTAELRANRRTPITVLIGRRDAFDVAMGQRLAALPGVEIVEVDSDHATFPHLRDRGTLQAVLTAFVDGRPIAPALGAPQH